MTKNKFMRIGIVCQNFPPAVFEGGVSHYSSLLADNLVLRGHEVFAITSTEFTKFSHDVPITNKVKVIGVKGPWKHSSIKKIKKIALTNKLDALVLQYSPASFGRLFRLGWALTCFNCQKITAFHTLWGKGTDRLIGLLMLLGSSKIIATNSEIMTILGKRLPLLLSKTYWIPIGSNILPSMSGDWEKKPVEPLISYFGMLYPGKGLDLILDVLEHLKKRKHRFSFKFVGGGMLDHQVYEAEFRNNINKRNLSGHVEHTGLIAAETVSRLLSQSRFVFLPYESGLSDRRGSFMAAIAHGKAVLTSPPIVETSFFKNGINAIWSDEPSLEEYIKLFERMIQDDELITRLEQGAKELSRQFRWEKIAAEYELAICDRHP